MTIEQRLDRLERENRMLKGAGGVVLLALLAVGVMGATQQEVIPDLVKARAFHVIGKDGDPRVVLRTMALVNDEVGKILTVNTKGKVLVDLATDDGGRGLIVTGNGRGKDLVKIGSNAAGWGIVRAYDPTGRYGFGQLAPN